MEKDKVPVPQMLFMNEVYLRSQVLESSYNTNTSVAVKQEDEQCSQRLESYNTNTSVAVNQEDEQCSQRLESYNTNTSVAVKQEDEQCSQGLESYNTNTSVAVKQDNDELCPQPSSLEIKTENPTVVYGLSNQTCDESLRLQRDEKEVNLTDHSSQLMRHNELDVVTDRFVSSHSQTDRFITNGFSDNEGENAVNDESDMSYLLRSVKGGKHEISTDPDGYEIKIETDEQVDIPFYTNVCPTTSVDEMSSEFLENKEEIIQDSDDATDTEEHLDIALPHEDAGHRDVDVHEEIKQKQPYVIIKKLDQLSIEKICQGLKNQMKKMTVEPSGAGPSHDATTTRVVGLEQLKGKQPIVVIKKLNLSDLLKYNKCDRNSMKSVMNDDKKGNESSSPSQFDSWRENKDFMSNSKMKCPLRSLSTEGDSLVQQPQTINTSDSGSGKFSGSSHRSLAGELLEKQKTTNRTPVCNETSSTLRTDVDETPYKCTVCDQVFIHRSHFRLHMRTHTGGKIYKCAVCDKAFLSNYKLTNHMRTHKGEKLYKCTVCDKAYLSNYKLIMHMRTHTGEKPYKCTVCDMAYFRNPQLTTHMRTHTGETHYKCTVCDKAYLRNSELTTHMRLHTGEKPYKCTFCDKAFFSNSQLTVHMRIHTGEKPYKCTVCDKACLSSSQLTAHMRTHTGQKPYKCTVCDKAYLRNYHLKIHMRTHTGEKPYKCTVCDKAYVRNSQLTVHMRTHTGEKPYKCTVCDKAFAWNVDLTRHMRTHTGEKPYKCTVCDKAFAWNVHLTTHMRTHTGEKPYKCTVCDKAFGLKAHLTIHMTTHTREKPFKCILCDNKAFSVKAELKRHVRCKHSGEKPYKCHVCDKTFAYRLSKHMRMHTGEKPFKCTVCGEAFMFKFRLRNHSRKHMEKKSFVCTVCDKAFFLNCELDSHMKVHTRERAYTVQLPDNDLSE